MPIGPRGERLPYNGNGNPGPDLPPMGLPTQPGIDATNAAMGVNRGGSPNQAGGDVMAAKQRLMQIAAEADAILTQHPELAQEMMGGGAAVGGVGGMPQRPVAGNTGARRGGNASSRVGIDATNSAMGMGRGLIA